MIPNAAEITRRRVTATTVVRLIAFLPILFLIVPIIQAANIWFNPADWNFGDDTALIGPLISGVVLILVAAGVWAIAPWSARKAIRVPRVNTCPGCHYKIEGLNAPQCPECGLALTPEYLSGDLGEDRREVDTTLLRQVCVLVLRGVSIVFIIPLAMWLFANTMYFLFGGYNHIDSIAEVAVQILSPAIGVALTGVVILRAGAIAVAMVPSRAALGERQAEATAGSGGA